MLVRWHLYIETAPGGYIMHLPSGVKAGIYLMIDVYTIAADTLAPCVARPSAAMLLTK